ncbi:MAG: tetratricopeptide repeat protein [Candidatus Competibacteraceae bacterium]
MDYYVSDDEQVERLKKWWQDNAKAIFGGIAIGLAVVLGWQYWTAHRTARAEQASAHYAVLQQAVEQQDTALAQQQGQILLKDFSKSAYAVLASLELAKLAAQSGDNAAAGQHLQWVIAHTRQAEIKDIARLRLVRVLLAENRYDDAAALLNEIGNPNLTAEREELRGDLYAARNEPAKAREAYQAALGVKTGNPLLRLKLDNLPAAEAPKE